MHAGRTSTRLIEEEQWIPNQTLSSSIQYTSCLIYYTDNMTGSTTIDAALVHVETHDTFDKVNSDKIAEAEALAAEALRMANEAKRAAERLAEVKKTLAMFSKKLDKVQKVVIVKQPSKPVEDDATPFEADKAAAAVVKKQEDAPAQKEDPQTVEEPIEEELPPPVEEDEEEFVPPPPPPAPVAKAAPAPAPVAMAAPATVETVEIVKKDFFEATLDQWGADKMCGVDEQTLAEIQAKEMGLPVPVVVRKAAPAPKKVEKKAALVVTREATPAPKVEKPFTETQIVVVSDDEGKDFFERTLDSWGVDRLCGVDDVALGFKDSYPVLPPPKPVPFENPTRIEYKKAEPLEIVHSESLKEQRSKEIREQRKYYQRAPTNYDFADPFGVDHDDLAMCGRLADLCEPDLSALQQPQQYVITAARSSAALPEPEKSILKKEKEAPKEDAPAASESAKNVSFQEAGEDVSLRGVEPEGAKNSFDSSNADNEPYYYNINTHPTYAHLRSTPVPPAEQRPVSVIVKVRSSTLLSTPDPVVTPAVEGRDEDQVYQRQLQIQRQKKEMLDAVDGHIWCV